MMMTMIYVYVGR